MKAIDLPIQFLSYK